MKKLLGPVTGPMLAVVGAVVMAGPLAVLAFTLDGRQGTTDRKPGGQYETIVPTLSPPGVSPTASTPAAGYPEARVPEYLKRAHTPPRREERRP